MNNSFNAKTSLDVNGRRYQIFALDALSDQFDLARLPVTLKILLENLLRAEDGVDVVAGDIEALACWMLVISRLWPVGVRVRRVRLR